MTLAQAPDPPSQLIDANEGTVLLRLVPFHLDRLHGRWPKGLRREGDVGMGAGLPFPLLPNSRTVDVVLTRGMTPNEASGGLMEPNSSLGTTSWWRWHGYAYTPFGWSPWPTPFFEEGRLKSLALGRHGHDEEENFDAMHRYLVAELGRGESSPNDRKREFRWALLSQDILLHFEPRDDAAELRINWR